MSTYTEPRTEPVQVRDLEPGDLVGAGLTVVSVEPYGAGLRSAVRLSNGHVSVVHSGSWWHRAV